MRHLLILACSQRKRSDADSLPAIERYDGPTFRLLRRFLRKQPSARLEIYILSAKFGLIPSDYQIPNYDQRMTKMRSRQLQPEVIAKFEDILSAKSYQKLCICLGQDYFLALDKYDMLIKSGLAVRIATGSLGKKLATLHDWLYGKPPELASRQAVVPQGKASLKGIEVVLTPGKVLDLVRQALVEGKGNPGCYQSWYVLVGDQRVSPKWVVSLLTGLPVSDFHSSAARRMLIQLGIEVRSE
ncbi:DUF6884 domain-containing protein [Microcoleus sp. D3_18a_C4]|uniref:DUF6884 domain-containing protein n=1 Tax=Microcoleus sp. D3_18a_C4 TaxID=3055332 RepID=UPI002FD781AD